LSPVICLAFRHHCIMCRVCRDIESSIGNLSD